MKKLNKKATGGLGIIIFLILLGIVYYFFIYQDGVHNPFKKNIGNDALEDPYINQIQGCINSGGNITSSDCCEAVGDFPNTCSIGACGCAPFSSHNIRVCNCGQNKCWNGTQCINFNI
jgi:hypothetical protein